MSATNNMLSTSQDSESKGSDIKKSHKKPVNSEAYPLRNKCYGNNLTQLEFGRKTLKTLCELLCKPVSVNITKLTPGTKTCESSLNKIQKEDAPMQKMKPTHNKQKTKRLLRKRIKSGKDDLHTNKANLQGVSLCKKKPKNIIKKDVNQPLIKLHRIDEVINKIAQSFAKVTTTKEHEASVHTTGQIELNESGLELPASTTGKEKNLQKCDYKNTRSRSSISKISKTNESETRIQIEHTEEYQNESNLSVSESSHMLNASTGKGFQSHGTENTVSDAQVNEISQTNECEANVQKECIKETLTELDASVPKLPLLSTAKKNRRKHAAKKRKVSKKKVSQPNKSQVRVQTKGIAKIQTEENASVPELSSSTIDKEKDIQDHKTRNTRSRSSINNVSQTNERETSVQTECIEEAQTESNASASELSSSTIDKEKDLQNHKTRNTRSRSSINNISQTNESETSGQTECVEEAQTESNASVSELSSSTIDKEKDLQNPKSRNTRSRSSINNISQTNECETSVQTECVEEAQTESNASVSELSSSTIDKEKDLQNHKTRNTRSTSSINNISQTNECETSVQTVCVEETQTESNASVSELSSPTIDKEKDLQNHKTRNTRSRSSINNISQTNDCETSVQTECIEETQTELSAAIPKSQLQSSGKKVLQNNGTESITSKSLVNKMLQTNECEASTQTESGEEAQTESSVSMPKPSSFSIGKKDLQNWKIKNTRSSSRLNNVSQTIECETSVQTECIEETQTELNASVPNAPSLSTAEKDLQNNVTKSTISRSPVDKILQTNECEASVHTESIETQTELNAFVPELSSSAMNKEEDLQNRETKNTRSCSRINRVFQTNESETNLETECIDEIQTELNASVPKSSLLTTDNKDLQNNVSESIIFKSPVNKILQTNECEASVHTECIEEAETELNASVSELASSTIDKEDIQNRETKNTRSRSSINKVSQTNECEINVKTKCMEEIQTELNASVSKSPLLSTGKNDLQSHGTGSITSKSPASKIVQTNECEASVHTECIEEAQTEVNASILELSSSTIDEEEDLQNRENKNTRSKSSINKVFQTNECETNIKTEGIEDIQAELNASASKSPLLNTGNKDVQNDRTESITSISPANKILQTNECETSVQRECTEGAQIELNASASKLPSSAIDKEEEDLQSHETENATSESSINKVSQINKGETSVQTDCIEETQTELNASLQRSPSLSTAKKNLPNSGIKSIASKSSVTEISQTNDGEASVQTECIEETQTELNASIPKSPSLSTAKEDLPHDRTESTTSKSSINESSQKLGNGVQSSKSDSSDSEEIYRTNKRWRFRRIRKILSDSDDDSDNNDVHDRSLKIRKRLRMDSPENETGTSTVNEKHNVPQTKYTDKNLLHPESSQELNASDELCNRSKSKQSKIKNKTVRSRYSDNDVRKTSKEGSRRNRVSSKLNTVRGKKDTVSLNVKNVDSTRIAESVLNNEEIKEPIQEPSALDKSLIQKYKLFRELRAVLIRFDLMKRVTKRARISTTPNRYSAKKTERLIKAYRNSILSLERPKLFNYAEPKFQELNENHSTDRPKESVKSTTRDLKIILCKTPSKENYIVFNEKQTPSKSLSPPSKKVPSDSNKKIRQESSLEIQKACHNLSELFADKSKKSKQNITSGSENQRNKKSASTTVLSCSSQKSTNKTKEKSRELTTDARSTEKTDINTFAATLSSLENKTLTFKIPKKIPVTKQSVPSYTSTHSPIKHKKPVDMKDSRNSLYKCIVCDLCFEDYSELQQHLIVHTQKQSNAVSNSAESINTPSAEPEKVALEVSKTLDTSEKKGVKRALPKPKSPEGSKHRKKKKLSSVVDSNNCTICSQVFVNKTDLAAHIFLHTERELQNAYHQIKDKLNKSKEKEKSVKTKRGTTENEKSIKDNVKKAAKKSSKAVKPKENPVAVQKTVETLPAPTTNVTLPAQNNPEPSGLKEISSATRKLVPLLPKPVKEKTDSSKKSYSICKCHSKAGTNENCLQIEIILLCHACKVLFRSVNCFESHYLLPEHENCNRHRLESGRSPNLFCASCGMLFGSVQDVCHHLETHARFKKDCMIDFRCNICKVVFLGIGSLFYIHWSKHAKDPLWVADENSFPREAILKSAVRREDNSEQNIITSDVSATESYIHVAEYVCNHCKFPFVTEDDLKKHVRRCDASNSSVRKPVKVKLLCSLCNHDFNQRSELYNHMKDKHMLTISTPQYFCIGQPPNKVLFICNLCMKTTDNMEDFEDHWLNHNVTNMFFNCMHCNEIYQNSLNSFVEHAREHDSETCSTVFAIVSYGKSKFICTRCQIGFSSLLSLNTHLIIHKQKRPETSGTSVQLSNEENLASSVTRVLELVEPNTSTATKQPERSSQMEAQTAERATEARSIRSSTESDKEKLLRILEENEDDSEHELVIDLTDHVDELNELSTGKGNQESQQASTSSNFVSDTSSIGQPCTTLRSNLVNTNGAQTVQSSRSVTQSVTTAAKSLQSVPQNVETMMSSILSDKKPLSNVTNCSDPLSSEATKISQQLIVHDVESIQDTGIQDTVSVMNQEEAGNATTFSTSRKQSPPRPKVGLLRVKTLAELRAPAYQCEICHAIVASADELKKHVSSHNVSNKDNTTEKEISSKQFAHCTTATGKIWKPAIAVHSKLQTPPSSSASSSSSVSPVYNIAAPPNQPIVKPRPTTMNNQQPQRLEANVNQNRQPSSASNVTSAYHKNLPASNIIRNILVPRSAVIRRDGASVKGATTTTAQDVRKTFATVAPVSTNEKQRLTSFIKVLDTSNNQFIYKCKYCEFRSKILSECLRHQLPGTSSSCRAHNTTQVIQRVDNVNNLRATSNILPKDQNYKQYQPVVNRSGIKPGSSTICYRYPYIVASSSANSNQMVSQNQQILSDTSVAGRASSSVFYKNPNHSSGGMSIVINQTAPSVQNLPTIGFLHQTPQQQVYQSQAYSEPLTMVDASFLQQSQSQNVSDFSGPSDMYQVANNQHETSNMQEETVTTYELSLPPGTFVCPHCLNTFISEDMMEMHMNTHHNFVCDICNLRLYSFNELNVHKIKHTLL